MNTVDQVVKVGIADLKLTCSPELLRTSGLGSCVGVVIYDPSLKIAGMAHVMLPDSELNRNPAQNMWKFADTAVEALYHLLLKNGARKYNLKAKIAGGAQMFTFTNQDDKMRIGVRNVEGVKKALKKYKIPLISEDTGGNNGRTIEFSPETCILKVKTANKVELEI